MTITREQVADLQPGDVVEYRRDDWPEGAFVRSPLNASDFDKGLYVLDGQFGVRTPDGRPYEHMATLTVVSRAPRPLFVNHPRTAPLQGDVARDDQSAHPDRIWVYTEHTGWHWTRWPSDRAGGLTTVSLRLLVDGSTGQVVP